MLTRKQQELQQTPSLASLTDNKLHIVRPQDDHDTEFGLSHPLKARAYSCTSPIYKFKQYQVKSLKAQYASNYR